MALNNDLKLAQHLLRPKIWTELSISYTVNGAITISLKINTSSKTMRAPSGAHKSLFTA